MSNRYEKIFFKSEHLYAENAPVYIESQGLFADSVSGRYFVLIKFVNVSGKPLSALRICVVPDDKDASDTESRVRYEYTNLSTVQKGGAFGQDKVIILKDIAYSYTVMIDSIMFADGSSFSFNNTEFKTHSVNDDDIKINIDDLSDQAPKRIICSRCGSEIQAGQEYCPKCGKRVEQRENRFSFIGWFNGNKRRKKLLIRGTVAAVIAVALIITGINVLPKIFVSVDDLCAEGKYEKAYAKAKKDKKEAVYDENQISVLSAEAVDDLKDPSSFNLRGAWIDDNDQEIVLEISAKNGFGGVTTSYWYYTYDDDDEKYELYTAVNDLDQEDYSWYDDDDETLEKYLDNNEREEITKIITSSSMEIEKQSVKNINNLYKKDLLDEVKLLDIDKKDNNKKSV